MYKLIKKLNQNSLFSTITLE